MKFLRNKLTLCWLPAIAIMLTIFAFSSLPSNSVPDFNSADIIIKKGAHALGYGLLALTYLYAFQLDTAKVKFAWLLAFLYAISDEYHQSFVLGRYASWLDVMIDSAGAAIALKILDIRLQTSDLRPKPKLCPPFQDNRSKPNRRK